MSELISGLYEQLVTVELQRLLSGLGEGQTNVAPANAADAHIAAAGHLRRLLERALHAIPEDERLTRQAEVCNALLEWLRPEQRSDTVAPDDALVVPLPFYVKFGRSPGVPRFQTRPRSPWFRCSPLTYL